MDSLLRQLNASSGSSGSNAPFLNYLPSGNGGEPNPQNESIIAANVRLAEAGTKLLGQYAEKLEADVDSREVDLQDYRAIKRATQATREKLATALLTHQLIDETREVRCEEALLEEEQHEYAAESAKRKREAEVDEVIAGAEHQFNLEQARHEASLDTRSQTLQTRVDDWAMDRKERIAEQEHEADVLCDEAQLAYDSRERILRYESKLRVNELRRQVEEASHRETKRQRHFAVRREKERLEEKALRLENQAAIDDLASEIEHEKDMRALSTNKAFYEECYKAFSGRD